MKAYVKVTDRNKRLSGSQKAAILLSELGYYTSDAVLSYIPLSQRNLHKLRVAMQSLGEYDPGDEQQVHNEIIVLEEALRFGKSRGLINTTIAQQRTAAVNNKTNALRTLANNDPDTIAQLLNEWMDNSQDDEDDL